MYSILTLGSRGKSFSIFTLCTISARGQSHTLCPGPQHRLHLSSRHNAGRKRNGMSRISRTTSTTRARLPGGPAVNGCIRRPQPRLSPCPSSVLILAHKNPTVSMGCNLSRPLCFSKSKGGIRHDEHNLSPMESVLSQLPFFSENSVDERSLPPRYPTVCEGCWEGAFAIHLGLPCVSATDGRLYRNWPRSYSYSISPTELKSRADMGCVWCRLLVAAHGGESSFADPSRPLEIR